MSGGGHEGFLVGSGSGMEASQSCEVLAGAVVVLVSTTFVVEESYSDSSVSGAVESVISAWLSASMAGRVRSRRLLI
jgi:hypothetical protein